MSIEHLIAQDLFNVTGSPNLETKLSRNVQNFRINHFNLDDRSHQETDYSFDELKELIIEIAPMIDLADGLYEKSSRARLERLLECNFEDANAIYADKLKNGFSYDEMSNAFELISKYFQGH